MQTRIVFGGGKEIGVDGDLEAIRLKIQEEGTGRRLLYLERIDEPRKIYVNPATVAFLERAD